MGALFCGSWGGTCGQHKTLSSLICECIMSILVFALVVYTLSVTGHLDKILDYFGYCRSNATFDFWAGSPASSPNNILIARSRNDNIENEFDFENILIDNLNNASAVTKLHKTVKRLLVSKIMKAKITTAVLCEPTTFLRSKYLSTTTSYDFLTLLLS